MGQCKCGFTTDADNNCNGTHNVVKKIKNKIISDIELIDLTQGELNALGMKMSIIEIIKNIKG